MLNANFPRQLTGCWGGAESRNFYAFLSGTFGAADVLVGEYACTLAQTGCELSVLSFLQFQAKEIVNVRNPTWSRILLRSDLRSNWQLVVPIIN